MAPIPTRSRDRNHTIIDQRELAQCAREELSRKCCLIRMQYHPLFRVAFEVIWRVLFLLDLVSDLSLCLSFNMWSPIWWLFASAFCVPYILSSVILFLPFHRRMADVVHPLILLPLYALLSLPGIACLDLYICTRLLTTDLATTRYLLYYWRLKTLVELTFEAIPQTLMMIMIGLGAINNKDNEIPINLHLLYGSLTISVLYFAWYCLVIYYGAQSTKMSICGYLWRYYIMQGMDMIPYQEAITQNLLSDFILTSESLTLSEWDQLTADLFGNFSIVQLDISGQNHLHFKLWVKLFECLANNDLVTLRLNTCFIFHPQNCTSDAGPLRHRGSRSRRLSLQHKAQSKNISVLDGRNPNLSVLKAAFHALLLNAQALVVVDLSGNCLEAALKAMVKPLSRLKRLKELYLARNRLGLSEARYRLGENEFNMLFRGCVSLVTLDLSDNGYDDAAVDVICTAMRQCKERKQLRVLKNINLDENRISIQGANELLGIIQHFRKLSITLQQNNIAAEHFEEMQSKTAIDTLLDDL